MIGVIFCNVNKLSRTFPDFLNLIKKPHKFHSLDFSSPQSFLPFRDLNLKKSLKDLCFFWCQKIMEGSIFLGCGWSQKLLSDLNLGEPGDLRSDLRGHPRSKIAKNHDFANLEEWSLFHTWGPSRPWTQIQSPEAVLGCRFGSNSQLLSQQTSKVHRRPAK